MYRCKYNKANTNNCHVMGLVRVVFFKDCPASFIVIFTLPLKKKATFCTKALATDTFSSAFMNYWLWFYYWFRRGFYPKSLRPEKKNPLVSPVEPASRTSPVEPAWRLRFIDGFKFICSARSMGNIFTVQIWIIYIDIVACKMCVITSVRSWMGSMFQNSNPWLPNIFQALPKIKVRFMRPKDITICWWQGWHATKCVCVVCVCMCYEPRTGMLRHTPLESSRRQSRIATVYSWHWNWQTLL